MPKLHHLFVDAGGGDRRTSVIAGAIKASLILLGRAEIHLVGPKRLIQRVAAGQGLPLDQVVVHDCDLVIPMNAKINARTTHEKNTLVVAAQMAKHEGGGLVSCGHTGALYMVSNLTIGRLDGVRRTGLAACLPTQDDGLTVLLDAGGMVDCQPLDLAAFALLGTAYYQAIGNGRETRVGLLSNGTETGKGNDQTKAAFALLSELAKAGKIDFVGNVEGTDLFTGAAQVIVADGFVGNVALKTAEAAAKELGRRIKDGVMKRGLLTRLCALRLRPVFRAVHDRLDYRHHNGAAMLGCAIPVVKGHGASDALATENAVLALHRLMERDPIMHLTMALAR